LVIGQNNEPLTAGLRNATDEQIERECNYFTFVLSDSEVRGTPPLLKPARRCRQCADRA